jgi:hypothetical protein
MPGEFIARQGLISRGNVIVTGSLTTSGSLTTTGTITATTLVVQTITSSISSITGSTNFGSLSSNTHTFTGSLNVSGSAAFSSSLTVGGPLTVQAGTGLTKFYFTAAGPGDALNQLYDNAGTVKIQLYANGDSYLNGGKVGIGTATPQAFLHIAGQNGTNTLTLGTSNNYEIFITGSDSANIYHASPNQAIYLNTNGGPLYLGPSSSSTLLTVTGSNVGIGTSTPTATLQVRGPNAVGTFFDAQNAGAGGAVFSRINAGSFPYNQYLFNNGYVGVGATSPLSKLEVNGTIKSTELDAPNRQTIIKSSGIAGTLYGTLTISIPTMSDGAGSIGYGGFSCEVYIAGYDAKYCHVWFSGYVNGGVSAAEVTILRSSGGWAANMIDNGAQGQTFIVDIPAASIVHPTARIIWNKGGSNNSAGTNGELITATWS